jgi:acetyl-CoA carboxylase carboxyl transferase alpha subunit
MQRERVNQKMDEMEMTTSVECENDVMEEKTLTAWEKVQIARESDRAYTQDYINHIFDQFMKLHGDRLYRDDGAIVGGIASIEGQFVTVIGQQKGRNLKENEKRNFGMPYPEGYRKALRLMKQAEKFNRPIICFIDTPGAYCGMDAEERGQGEAIARNLYEMSGITVPILSIVIGEGGSGGALALGVANEVWMLENATYSILSPEGFASILWKDSKRAGEAAECMKITANELKKLGIVEQVIREEEPVTDSNCQSICQCLRKEIVAFLQKYRGKTKQEIVEERYERFRAY